MYLFNRTVTLQGDPREIRPMLQDITELVNDRAPFGISLWQSLFGNPVGTFSWSALVDSRAVLAAAMTQIESDDEVIDLEMRLQKYAVGPPENQLANIMHTAAGERTRAPLGSAASITIAQMEVGRAGEAIEWSIGMADLAASIVEEPVSLCSTEHGAFGELGWVSTAQDIAEVDRAQEALNKDPEYMSRLTRAGELFVPGSGRQLLSLRIA